ncbi:MAG TPA: hypothetical protein VGU23_08390 [Acidobacteriaceae bacterium]|nr:hypothetical protein [Acidobacteriaceae bacterium]
MLKPRSRYPLTLIALTILLGICGFLLALTGSKPLAGLFVACYLAVAAGWIHMMSRGGS